ncbi:MAG: hypothetical protein IJQ76_05715 [Prevotella sp.]|nr:hypothetical protein [Prevotella sp.]
MKSKLKAWHVMLLVFMGVFFVRNLMLPMVSDDIPYAFVWNGEDRGNLLDGVGPRERITSFGDIVRSQYSHYMTWGGRIIGIGLTQLFAWEGKHLFNVLNTLVFIALALLIYKIGTGKRLSEMNVKYMSLILFALWFLLPDPFLTTLWMCGSCVFLWTAVIDLLFLLPFAKAYWKGDDPLPSRWSVPQMAFAGLCAGWSVETGAFVTAFITFFAIIWFWRQKQLKGWMVVGFVFLCIGGLMLGLAPGEIVRLELQRKYEYNPGLPEEMYWTPLMYYINYVECIKPVVSKQVPLLLLIAWYVWRLPKGKRWNKTTLFQVVMTGGAMAVMLVLVFVPMAPARAGFFSTCAILAASLAAFRELLKEQATLWQHHRQLIQGFVVLSMVLWIATTVIVLYVERDVNRQWMSRIDYINAHQDQDIVVVHQIDVPPIADELPDWWLDNCATWNTVVLAWGSDLEPREEGSHNLMYAQYYGWKKVITDGEDRRIESMD